MNDNQEKTVGGIGSAGFGVLVVWLAGHFGLNMSAEIGTIVGALMVAFGASIAAEGIIGMLRHLLWGKTHDGNHDR